MFNICELSLIKMYAGLNPDRDKVLQAMREALPLIEEQEIRDMMESTIRKVNAMTKEAFSKLDLDDTFETSGHSLNQCKRSLSKKAPFAFSQ